MKLPPKNLKKHANRREKKATKSRAAHGHGLVAAPLDDCAIADGAKLTAQGVEGKDDPLPRWTSPPWGGRPPHSWATSGYVDALAMIQVSQYRHPRERHYSYPRGQSDGFVSLAAGGWDTQPTPLLCRPLVTAFTPTWPQAPLDPQPRPGPCHHACQF